ncbi:Bacterioferritin-associated ferredoxin [uncultured Candidatus Thioglobus sp.]|nr:Bacterioferritin-associated ferredoxin [uncultured Candidatus Thioglobus sp.]
MYVCICNAVTDKDINQAIKQGARSLNDLSTQLKVGTCCGRCKDCAKKILDQSRPFNIQTLNFPSFNLETNLDTAPELAFASL